MKLHLPKQLFTALLAAITLAAPAAWGASTAADFITIGGIKYGTDDDLNNAEILTGETKPNTGTAHDYVVVAGGRTQITSNMFAAGETIVLAAGSYTTTDGNETTFAGGQLFVNAGSVNISNNIILGSSSYSEGINNNWGGAMRLHDGEVTLSGTITLVQDARVVINRNAYFTNTVQGAGKTLTLNDGSSSGKTVTFSGSACELGGLVSSAGIIFNGGSGNTYTIGNISSTGNITVQSGSVKLTGEMSGSKVLSVAEGAQFIVQENATLNIARTITGAGTLTNNGTLHISDATQLNGYTSTYTAGASGFRTGFTATLLEGTTLAGTGSLTFSGQVTGDSTSMDNGVLTVTFANNNGVYYINDAREYATASGIGDATSLEISSAGSLSVDLSAENTTVAAPKPIANSGALALSVGANAVNLNSLFGTNAISQTATGTTTISGSGTISMSAALTSSGSLAISGTGSEAKATFNSTAGLGVKTLVLENATATISGGQQALASNITLNSGATLTINSGDLVNYGGTQYTWTVNEGATLNLGTEATAQRQTLARNFRLILAGGVVNGKSDDHGSLDYYNNNSTTATDTAGTIQVTKSSVLNAAVRARGGQVIFQIDGADTVLTMGSSDGGSNFAKLTGGGSFVKQGAGSLLYKGDSFDRGLSISGGVFEYYLENNRTHSGSISGSGTFRKSGSGTLTLSNATVASLNVAAGKLIYQLADNAETEVDHTLALELDSSASFEKTGEGTLNVGALHEAQFGAGIVVSQGVLQYNGNTGEKTGNPPKFVYLLRDVATTGTGKVQVVGDVKFNWNVHAASARTETVSSKVNVTGNLEINTWSTPADVDGDSMARWEVVDNGLLEVGGKLWMTNQQKLVVNGGAVDAGSVYLGHSSNSGGNLYSKVVIADGSLTTGNIAFVGSGNAVSMTGGVLTFTPETENKQVLVDGGHSGAGTISISGGTLAATTTDWTMTGTSNHQISLGNVTFDVAAGKTVTLAGSYDLTGSLSLIGNTVVENESTSTGALTLTGTMNITSLQNLKHAEGQYAEGIADSNGFNLYYYYLVENTDGASISTAGLSVTLSGAAVDVLQSSTGNHLLIYDGSQTGVYHVNTGTVSATNDIMGTEGFERYHVAKNANLAIDTSAAFSEDNRNSVLTSTTGSGSLVLSASASFGGLATVFQGDIRVTNEATLTLGALSSNQASVAGTTNVSSLSGIVLDGGNLKYQGSTGSIQSITALSDADFTIFDMTATNSVADTLSVGKVIVADGTTLTVNGASDGSYKHHLSVGQLSGAGDLTVYGAGNTTWTESQASFLTISSLEDFTGNISITSRENTHDGAQVDVYHAIVNTGVSGAVLKSLQFTGFGEQGENSTAVFNVQGDTQVDTLVATGGSVNLDAGTTLTLGGGTAEARKQHSIGTLSAAAAGVTLGDYATLTLGGGTAEAQKQHSIGTLSAASGSTVALSSGANLTLSSVSGVNGTIMGEGSLTLNVGSTIGGVPTLFGGELNKLVLSGSGTCFEITSSSQKGRLENIQNIVVENGATFGNRLTGVAIGTAAHTLTLSGAGADGGTGASAAALAFGRDTANSSDMTMAYTVNLADDATVWVNSNRTGILSGIINGDGALTKTGAGKLKLSGANTYTGGTSIEAGTVTTQNASALGTGDVNMTGGELVVSDVDNPDTDLTVGGAIVMNAAATAKLATSGTTLSLGTAGSVKKSNADGQYVTIASDGTNAASMTAKADNAQLVQLQEDASFTIQDMTLTNTTITAATPTTQVNFSNVTVEGATVLRNMQASMTGAKVTAGGSEGVKGVFTASTSLLSGITLANTDAVGSTIVVDLGDLSCAAPMGPGKYDLSITLSGFTMQDYTQGIVFAADSWLGQLLTAQGATAYVSGAVETPASVSEGGSTGGVSVSYSAATGGNVGTVITITGLNVPEPATSTLSLLALAALAARRRRK